VLVETKPLVDQNEIKDRKLGGLNSINTNKPTAGNLSTLDTNDDESSIYKNDRYPSTLINKNEKV